MTTTRLLVIGVAVGIAGGTAALARQAGRTPSPFGFEAPDLPAPAFEVPPLEPGSAPPEAPPTNVTASVAAGATPSWNSIDFIDKGKAIADRAIEDLSAERDELRARLREIEAELARWEAISNALAGAKDAVGPPGPDLIPPVEGQLDPLLELPSGGPIPPSDRANRPAPSPF